MSRIVLAVSTALAALGLAVVPVSSSAPAHMCTNANELWFRAADRTRLVGHRFGGKRPGARPAVVLAHMSDGDLCRWARYARTLARQGVFVFAFDLRGHGASEGRQNHRRAAADLAAAVRAVRSLGSRKVVVMGASLGGVAALVAAPNVKPAVDGVVSISGPAAIAGTLNALPAVARIQVPTLYVAAEADQNPQYDFAADARTLYDATATSEKRLEIVPGSLHGTFLVDGAAAVRAVLRSFIRDPRGSVRS